MKTSLFAFFALFAMASCQRSEQLTLKSVQDPLEVHPGKKLMETYCLSCHKPQGDHEGRLAPPMVMVKQHYLSEGMPKDEFVNNIVSWVEDPNWDHLKMSGAARRFGIMPKHGFPKDSIKLIADYLYLQDMGKNDSCGNQEKGPRRKRMRQNKS
ncbi:MAG: hypothetical protein KJO49_11185 [Bacteroidia bacterium]|nr:hypothetical protein [Bacteroidia bacterium]MBT8269578.1 hypothetical protein [Bacteroidia bacterium]NNF81143.1 hypothetical protein [Flavobacteriaceae bacterium]NNK70339.1 hypothetical protein [Flavobacteriaceae bacterium]NNL80887.1 hypothetical protein [Flavobacteriaceae bacterium]